ncbi:hypothetical protein NA56DRAFT_704137 [Hyaloscypha hepaticicola]|uniref:Uncharacterized protein n=1 Tax=Hyaloscypha hepaticicola TaxID=2082293 RepID=A0A2J6Q3P1_9HELO|nr:hypothetical protein NA56DRAFT_704137 [Hyaloscypha hepaticicola]
MAGYRELELELAFPPSYWLLCRMRERAVTKDGLYRSVQERNALPRHYAATLDPPEPPLVLPIMIIILILQRSFHDGFFRGHFPSFERPRIFLPTHYDTNKKPGKA